jgi:hypothetical protein
MTRTPEGETIKPAGDLYGTLEGEWVYVNNSIFRKAVKDAGFDDRALLSWLKSNNLIEYRAKNNTKGKRINGVLTECVVMKMPDEFSESDDFVEIL